MKKTIHSQRISFGTAVMCALLFVVLSAENALAQSNTFPSSGNAGIGTTSPTAPLEVVSSAAGPKINIRGTTASTYNDLRILNDQNSSLRSLQLSYAGSTFASSYW